jgi:hypothetical protein
VFGFVGASAGISVMYVIPSFVYLKLVVFEDRKLSFRNVFFAIPPVLMIIGGGILAIICTSNVIVKQIIELIPVAKN